MDRNIVDTKLDKLLIPQMMRDRKEGKKPMWERGFAIAGKNAARQFLTGHIYTGGVNCFSLAVSQVHHGYQYSLWVPWSSIFARQEKFRLKGLKSKVSFQEAGEQAIWVMRAILKPVTYEEDDGTTKTRRVFKGWGKGRVLNIDLLEDTGLKQKHLDIMLPNLEEVEVKPLIAASLTLREMPDPPKVQWGGDQPCYFPGWDTVQCPTLEQYTAVSSVERGWAAMFHELVHSTGHKKRLDREGIQDGSYGGWNPHGHEYSYEELVAEFGSSIIMNTLGIQSEEVRENTRAYLTGWWERIEENPSWLYHALQEGDKAARWILNLRKERDETTTHKQSE